jgi:hypothetical protein
MAARSGIAAKDGLASARLSGDKRAIAGARRGRGAA